MNIIASLRSAALALGLALSLSSTPASACGFCPPTYNGYIFKVGPYTSRAAYNISVDQQLVSAWNEYAHCRLTPDEVEALKHLRPEEVNTLSHPVLNYARINGDKEMQLYLYCLATYLQAVDEGGSYNDWEYPSSQQTIAASTQFRKVLQMLKLTHPVKHADRLRLLQMRVLYRLGDFTACDRLWAQSLITEPANVFQRMTCGFYAATLFARDRRDEAARLYALIGDAISARFCMNNRNSVAYMRSVADVDPNSSVLPFMVENFVNSLQETHDVTLFTNDLSDNEVEELFWIDYCGDDDGHALYTTDFTRLFNRDRFFNETFTSHFANYGTFAVAPSETEAFMAFSAEMLKRSDVNDPILWRTARAYIFYMRGQHDEAWAEINQPSERPASTAHIADCERLVRFLIATTLTDEAQMEHAVADLLPWLRSKVKEELHDYYNNEVNIWDDPYAEQSLFWQNAYYRILVHGLARHYAVAGDATMEHICYFLVSHDTHATYYRDDPALFGNDPFCFYQDGYSGIFNKRFQSLGVEQQAAIYNEIFRTRDFTAFQTALKDGAELDALDFIDVIGTHCLVLGRWAQAESWLKQVPIDYVHKQHLAQYAEKRNYTTELWFRHVRVDFDPWAGHYDEETDEWVRDEYPKPTFKTNPKIKFCRDVMRLEKELSKAKGEERCRKAYELATILAQASPHGDCWWLGRYMTSTGNFLSESAYEPTGSYPFADEAIRLANEASAATDPALRSRALMALLYMTNNATCDYVYDEATDEWTTVSGQDPRFDAVANNLLLLLGTTRDFDARISRCDFVVDLLRKQ